MGDEGVDGWGPRQPVRSHAWRPSTSRRASHPSSGVKKPFGTTSRRQSQTDPFSERPKMAALYCAGRRIQLNVKVTKRHLEILSLVTHVWR